MSEDLRQREASLVERQGVAKDLSGDVEGGSRPVAECALHEVEAFLVVLE